MLLERYCARLGSLVEHRYSSLALLEAKQQAENAAIAAHEAMLKAKAADRAKGKFLANMAHELRTPLNAIIGFSEVIKLDKVKTREHYREYAGHIYDAGLMLLDIINGILDLARIEAGKVQLQEEFVTLDTLIQSALTTIRPISQKNRSKSIVFLKIFAVGIFADPGKLTQVILNLLSNSVKFTEHGGRIQIATKFHKNGDLVLSISDTGAGIPAGLIQKIFQPFEQVEDHLTREHEGTGLGLPIARAIIELHGGELVLSSEVGVGTTARVRLPVVRMRHALGNGDGPPDAPGRIQP